MMEANCKGAKMMKCHFKAPDFSRHAGGAAEKSRLARLRNERHKHWVKHDEFEQFMIAQLDFREKSRCQPKYMFQLERN